nr:MAG: coat protein [Chemarfal virus 44]
MKLQPSSSMKLRPRRRQNIKATKKNKRKPKFVYTNFVPFQQQALSEPVKSKLEAICSVADPFCNAAIGSKYLDIGKVRSLSYSWHSQNTFASDLGGRVGMLCIPDYLNGAYVQGLMTGSVMTIATANATSKIANVSSYRIVSWGAKVRCIAPPLSASGLLSIRVFDSYTGADFASIDTTTYNCSSYLDVPLQAATEVCVVLGRLDVTSKKFIKPFDTLQGGSNVTNWVSPGFQSCTIAINGGPASTAVINVEFFVNYELTFSDSDGNQQLALPSHPYNQTISDATDTVVTSVKSIFASGAKEVASTIASASKQALIGALRSRISKSSSLLALPVD